MLLHDREELDNDLGARSDQDLALAGLLGVVDRVKSVVQDGGADHLDGIGTTRFSNRQYVIAMEMRYLKEAEAKFPQNPTAPPQGGGGIMRVRSIELASSSPRAQRVPLT